MTSKLGFDHIVRTSLALYSIHDTINDDTISISPSAIDTDELDQFLRNAGRHALSAYQYEALHDDIADHDIMKFFNRLSEWVGGTIRVNINTDYLGDWGLNTIRLDVNNRTPASNKYDYDNYPGDDEPSNNLGMNDANTVTNHARYALINNNKEPAARLILTQPMVSVYSLNNFIEGAGYYPLIGEDASKLLNAWNNGETYKFFDILNQGLGAIIRVKLSKKPASATWSLDEMAAEI